MAITMSSLSEIIPRRRHFLRLATSKKNVTPTPTPPPTTNTSSPTAVFSRTSSSVSSPITTVLMTATDTVTITTKSVDDKFGKRASSSRTTSDEPPAKKRTNQPSTVAAPPSSTNNTTNTTFTAAIVPASPPTIPVCTKQKQEEEEEEEGQKKQQVQQNDYYSCHSDAGKCAEHLLDTLIQANSSVYSKMNNGKTPCATDDGLVATRRVVFLDYDGTVLPTHFWHEKFGSVDNVLYVLTHNTITLTAQEQMRFKQLDKELCDVITIYCSTMKDKQFFLVSNASIEWINITSKYFLPQFHQLLCFHSAHNKERLLRRDAQKPQVYVVSARDIFGKFRLCGESNNNNKNNNNNNDGACKYITQEHLTMWKTLAFHYCLALLHNRWDVTSEYLKTVVSIGDAVEECEAAKSLSTYFEKSIHIHGCRLNSKATLDQIIYHVTHNFPLILS